MGGSIKYDYPAFHHPLFVKWVEEFTMDGSKDDNGRFIKPEYGFWNK